MENSERDGNTWPPDLPLEKSVCRSVTVRSSSYNWMWNNRLVPSRKRSTSRLYIVTMLINLYIEYIMRNAGLEEAQAGIKIAGRNINNLRFANDKTLMAESEELKRCLLLGRKVMTNLDSILKSRDITLPTKVLIIKAIVFPVVMYGCEVLDCEESLAPKN